MNVLLVYWHPEPQSFNGALFHTARETLSEAGHSVQSSDLHAMAFDPNSGRQNFTSVQNPDYFKQQLEEMHASERHGFSADIEAEIEKLEWCELMIWQFPLWWFGLPAVFKGWVDRVFVMGRVYGGGRIYENGVFSDKRAMLSLTTGGPQPAYQTGGRNGDLAGILRPIQRGMLAFTGFQVLAPHVVYAPVRLSNEERGTALTAYRERLLGLEREQAIDVGNY